MEDLSRMYGSKIRGWLNYYGRFYPSAMYPTLRQIDRRLSWWARRKFKKLRGHKRRSDQWLSSVAQRDPKLFPHWALVRKGVG
jgi:RNA-directed DNA polymerase